MTTLASPAPAPAKDPHGHDATSPWQLPAQGWKDVLLRTWNEAGTDNIGLIAAGVSFYGFLAMVPMLGAIVLSYGLVASPETVVDNMKSLTSVMPADAAKLLGEQLLNVVTASGDKKGFGLLIALGIALYGAMNGASAIVTALNIAYEEKEKRGFVKLKLIALVITLGAVLLAVMAILSVAALGHLEAAFPHTPQVVLTGGKLLCYGAMAGLGAAAAASLFRYGPDRAQAKWTWLTPGSLAATLLWLAATLGFGIYVAHFGSYDATYGSLGAVVVLLTWLYMSAYVLLLGAELNAELEHQTARDSTTGKPRPLGARRAHVADTVAEDAKPDAGPEKPMSDKPDADPAPSLPRAIGAARVTSRVGGWAGLERVGLAPSIAATVGLSLLRRPGRARLGLVLIAGASALAWASAKSSDEIVK